MMRCCTPAWFTVVCALVAALLTPLVSAQPADKDDAKVENRVLPPVPPKKDVPIDQSLQDEARKEIRAASASNDPVIRAHALEAAQALPAAEVLEMALAALKDKEPLGRFAGAMTIGDLKLPEGRPALLTLVDDESLMVRIGVRYALHRLGNKSFSHDLERTVVDPDKAIRGTTALVLGRMGEPSAAKLLRILERDAEPSVRLQAAEALWRLGDERGLKSLVAWSISGYPDDQIVAVLALGAPRDQRVAGHVQAALTADYLEVCLAAARAMGELGSDEGYGLALEGARSKDPRHRYLAAMALASIGRTDSQEALAPLLRDKESQDIRLAAAAALLKLVGK